MAEETLTLRMRERGAKQTARAVEEVGDEVEEVDKKFGFFNKTTKKSTDRVGMFERGLRVLQTRFGMLIIVAGIATLTLGPPMLGAIALLTAGALALSGAIAPMVILFGAVVERFNRTKEIAGTAAHNLAVVAKWTKKLFDQAMAKPAGMIMDAIAEALIIIRPLIKQVAPGFEILAGAASRAIKLFATAFAGMGPQLNTLFAQAAPLIEAMGPAMVAFLETLIYLGIAGIPVLTKMVEWLTDFLFWLGPAIQDANEFARSEGFLSTLADIWAVLGNIWAELWPHIQTMWGLLKQLVIAFWPLIKLALPVAILLFRIFAWGMRVALKYITWATPAAHWLARAIEDVANWVGVAAEKVWNWLQPAIEFLTPIVFWLGNAIADVVSWLVKADQKTQGWTDALGRWISDGYNWIKPKIAWLIEKLRWLMRNGSKAFDWATPGGDKGLLSGEGVFGVPGIPGIASGGPILRGGAAVVGERGPELVRLPTGSEVVPNHAMGGPQEVVIPLQTVLDGKVLAEAVHRQALRKKSTR